MWTLVVLCSVMAAHGVQDQPSCRYNCGYNFGSCSCSYSCQYDGNCCDDYYSHCYWHTPSYTTEQPSCRYNCGYDLGICSCSYSCQYYGNCCDDYNSQCDWTTPVYTTAQPSCQYNCGYNLGSCSCSYSCQYYGNCCYDYYNYCPYATPEPYPVSCGGYLYGSSGQFESPGHPSNYPNNVDCTWYIRPGSSIVKLELLDVNIESVQNCVYDAIYVYDGYSSSSRLMAKICGTNNDVIYSTGSYLTVRFRTDSSVQRSGFRAQYSIVAQGSCKYNCGYWVGNCSCSASCEYSGNCCPDYTAYCYIESTTAWPILTTEQPSCRYNCGYDLGICSCSYSCQYYGNCCYDYYSQCDWTTPVYTTAQPSCQYNCGYNLGSCSCSYSCQYYGNCCYDYYNYCPYTTPEPYPVSCGGYLYGSSGQFESPGYPSNYPANVDCIWYIRAGRYVKLELLDVNIESVQNCVFDAIYVYDGSSSSSRLMAKICGTNNDVIYSTGYYLTVRFKSDNIVHLSGFHARYSIVAQGSCKYNCGYWIGNCSCSASCEYSGNCCPDYAAYCYSINSTDWPTEWPTTETSAQPSCQYNCGYNLGICSCSSSCQYYGNCCYDYNYYCPYTTPEPYPEQPSCRYNCGYNLGICSCSSSCQYYGNCCYDYYYYCPAITTAATTTATQCGGTLYGSGAFTSPHHPDHYDDNLYCAWYLRTEYNQRIYLEFTYLELENCCGCDYIAIYDGSYIGSSYLGNVCNDSLTSYISTSNYMTVLFRTDSSVVARGFKAEFSSVLKSSSGRVECSSDQMNIVISKSYLDSIGHSGDELYVNDPQCRPQVSYYQTVFNFPLTSCGTVQRVSNGRIEYVNAIRASNSSNGVITRQSNFKINVGCRMDPDSVSQNMYVVQEHSDINIGGTGNFNTTMDFYTSSSFYYKVTDSPYEVLLNQRLYVQVKLEGYHPSTKVYIDTCVTSPSPYFQTTSYYLVRNGCRLDDSYLTYSNGAYGYTRFSFQAFQFLQGADAVYIQCVVRICPQSDVSRCRPSCYRRKRRDLRSQYDRKTVVLGPFKLKGEAEKEEEAQEQTKA
ncbi:uncharacterized protein V6R79_007305 [Siganus canaliculatus]